MAAAERGQAGPAVPAYMYVSHVVPHVVNASAPDFVTMGPRSTMYMSALTYATGCAPGQPKLEPFQDVEP